GNELRRFLYDDASALVHVRSYFFDRALAKPPSLVALAGGGWFGLQTGWFYDTVQLGAVGYTTQPLWAPQNKQETSDGTLLVKKGGYGFFALGQAYASARYMGQTFTGYRQHIDELEVNPWDNRMLPQTFEAYAMRGKLFDVSYFAGYVAAIKPRDYSVFINMAEQAGRLYGAKPGTALSDNRGMALVSLKYGDANKLALRGMYYLVPDVLWSSYYDAVGTIAIDESLKVKLYGQFGVQGSDGLNLLTGTPFSTFMVGLKADVIWGPLTLTGGYMQIGKASDYKTPYGIFIGYNKQQVLDFTRAAETGFQAGARFDFKSVGLPGVSFFANAVSGFNAINATTGAPLRQTW
ncbi:MAG: outer membrane porin, OprD family, partial [Gallionellaceae bacterium]